MIFKKMVCLGAALSLLACCHAYVPPQSLPENCTFNHLTFDLRFCWKVVRGPGGFTVPGYVTNSRYDAISGLELTATLLDDQGKPLGEASYFVIPPQLQIDETSPFTLVIPVTSAARPAQIKFLYRYRLAERAADQTNYNSFVTDLR